jgi:hypothetical protein
MPTVDLHRALLAVSEAIVSHRDLTTLFQELADSLHRVVQGRWIGSPSKQYRAASR